jgi:hypothetical protein
VFVDYGMSRRSPPNEDIANAEVSCPVADELQLGPKLRELRDNLRLWRQEVAGEFDVKL